MEFNVLTLTLNNFIGAFESGGERLQPAANTLLVLLGTIEVVLLGLWWALGGGERLVAVFKKLLFLFFWGWFVREFPALSKAFVGSLIQAGLTAGGKGGSYQLLLDPSAIAGHGLDATEKLLQRMQDLGALDVGDYLIYGVAYVLIMIAFGLMAINVFLSVLESYLFLALVVILMPFGLNQHTKFLAEKAIGAVVSAGVKLMVLAFVMAVIDPVFAQIRFKGPEISFNEAWAVLLTAAGCAYLAWQAPRLASGLLAGAPVLSGADAAVTAGAAAGMAATAGVAGAGAAFGLGKLGARAGAGAVKSVRRAASSIHTTENSAS